MFLNELVGTKMRATPGYTPSHAMLAMERGEVDGLASILWLNLQTVYQHLMARNKLNILVQIGTERDPNLPNVPLLSELAKSPDDKNILEAISSSDVIGRTVLAPPGVPQARVSVLRKAMMDALKDPELLAQAKKMNVDISPLDGEKLQALVAEASELQPEMVTKIRGVIAANAR